MESNVKDCSNCFWGKYNDHYDLPFCYCLEKCIEWDKWKEKENE